MLKKIFHVEMFAIGRPLSLLLVLRHTDVGVNTVLCGNVYAVVALNNLYIG